MVRTNESLCAKVLFSIAVVTKVTPLKPCDMIVMTEREKETNLIPSDSRAHTNSRLCRYLTHAHSHIHRVVAAMDSCFSSAWHNRWTPVESSRTRTKFASDKNEMRKLRPCKCGLRNYEKFTICQTTISPSFSSRMAERAKFVSAPCENRRAQGKARRVSPSSTVAAIFTRARVFRSLSNLCGKLGTTRCVSF